MSDKDSLVRQTSKVSHRPASLGVSETIPQEASGHDRQTVVQRLRTVFSAGRLPFLASTMGMVPLGVGRAHEMEHLLPDQRLLYR